MLRGICLDHQGIIEFVLVELFAPEKEVVEPVELPCWFWFWKGFCKKLAIVCAVVILTDRWSIERVVGVVGVE